MDCEKKAASSEAKEVEQKAEGIFDETTIDFGKMGDMLFGKGIK